MSVIRCSWCQLVIDEPHLNAAYKDKLVFHGKPILQQQKSCLEHYENYCRWIKEKTE